MRLAGRLHGQQRIVVGMGAAAVVGFDMTAALAMARAMGVSEWAAAELLPWIEQAMAGKIDG